MKTKTVTFFFSLLSVSFLIIPFQNCAPDASFQTGSDETIHDERSGGSLGSAASTEQEQPSTNKDQDPGLYTGFWVPPGSNNLIVADQSGGGGVFTYIPGCLNGRITETGFRGCAENSSLSDSLNGKSYTFSFKKNMVLSLRLKSKMDPEIFEKEYSIFRLNGSDGGNCPVLMSVWLSEAPGGDPLQGCYAQAAGSPTIFTSSVNSNLSEQSACKIKPNTLYYYNIKKLDELGDSAGGGVRLIFQNSNHF